MKEPEVLDVRISKHLAQQAQIVIFERQTSAPKTSRKEEVVETYEALSLRLGTVLSVGLKVLGEKNARSQMLPKLVVAQGFASATDLMQPVQHPKHQLPLREINAHQALARTLPQSRAKPPVTLRLVSTLKSQPAVHLEKHLLNLRNEAALTKRNVNPALASEILQPRVTLQNPDMVGTPSHRKLKGHSLVSLVRDPIRLVELKGSRPTLCLRH